MNTPFAPSGKPFAGEGPGGLCFGPEERRALHEQRRQARRERRQARRESHDHLRGHDAGHGGFGCGMGPGPHGGRHGRRKRRGDARAAILLLLAERPMHGYEMIQEIAARSQDLWRPSPGSVYPTLQLLVDEDLIVGSETDDGKRLFELTEAGRNAAEKIGTPPWEEITDGPDPSHIDLRAAVEQLSGAVAQSAHAATPGQQQRIIDIVDKARREVYTILGEDE